MDFMKLDNFIYRVLMMAILSLVVTSCSSDGVTPFGEFSNQSPMEQSALVIKVGLDVTDLKEAFSNVNKDWNIAKNNFTIGRVKSKEDRVAIKNAVEAIDTALHNIESVRHGNVVDKIIVLKDVISFRKQLTEPTNVLEAQLNKHDSLLTKERKVLYSNIVFNLKRIVQNDYSGYEADDKLMRYFTLLANIGKIAKSL